MISDGSGIMADSIAMATSDAQVADAAVQVLEERDDDLVDEVRARVAPRPGRSAAGTADRRAVAAGRPRFVLLDDEWQALALRAIDQDADGVVARSLGSSGSTCRG